MPADKADLYHLLADLAHEADVPGMMAADFAVECADLVEVRDRLAHPERGSVLANRAGYGLSYVKRLRAAIDHYRDRDPIRLVAVGCSGSKHTDADPLPAARRYKGGYWTNKREYAEAAGEEWRIISAEHDLLHPATPIHDYERTPSDLEGVPVDVDGRLPSGDSVDTLLDLWALRVYEGLTTWIRDIATGPDPREIELEILLGLAYHKPLDARGVFDALRGPGGLDISHPFREVDGLTGIGKQRGWLADETAAIRDGDRS
ncbi:DUF6884 domain-containing protein [Halobacteriaceae archaeon GCM10025711]